jgi:hypothetical protein
MHKGKRIGMAIAAMMVLSVAAPAYGTHDGTGEIHPTFRLDKQYFSCLASNRIQNVGRLNGEIPGWGATEPASSLQAGGGCFQYENLVSQAGNSSPHDLTYRGTFTGNIESITIELHLAHASSFAASDQVFGSSILTVDGTALHTSAIIRWSTVNNPNGTDKVTFTYTKIDKVLAPEDADGVAEHEVQFTMLSANEEQIAWLWGASDAPASITFNPTTKAPTKIPVG